MLHLWDVEWLLLVPATQTIGFPPPAPPRAPDHPVSSSLCTDKHRPYVNAVAYQLPKAEIVFDEFTSGSMHRPRATTRRGRSVSGLER